MPYPKQRQTGRTGQSSMAYLGVLPESPPNMVSFDRDPTTLDYKTWELGDIWLNRNSLVFWFLAKKENKTATWVTWSGGTLFVGLKDDAGIAAVPNGAGYINVLGDQNITTNAALPLINTLDITLANLYHRPVGVLWEPVIVDSTGKLGSATLGVNQFIIGDAAGNPQVATLTAGANITITNGAGSITITAAAGPGGDITLVGNDLTTATSVGQQINVFGTNGIVTYGDGANTFTIDGAGTSTTIMTNDATPTVIESVPVVAGTLITFKGYVDALQDDTSDGLGSEICFTVYRPLAGDITLIGTPIININTTSLTLAVEAGVDVGTQSAIVTVTGNAGETWTWRYWHKAYQL